MAFELTDLDTTTVEDAATELVAFIKAGYPSLDLTPGRVLYDLLIRPAAIFYTLNNTNLDAVRNSQSLLLVEADPDLASEDVISGIASNFGVTRMPGDYATGTVTIVLSKNITTPISADTQFSVGDLTFVTETAYTGVPDGISITSTNDRDIVDIGGGLYSFTVPVKAAETGADYRVDKNTRFSVDPEPNFLTEAYAESSFVGGSSQESIPELITRLNTGITAKSFSGRAQIRALILDAYEDTADISIVGYGDEEMIRDRNNIFALSHGGKVDVYFRSQSAPQKTKLTLTGTLVSDRTWEIQLDKDTAPAFYTIDSVLKTEDTSVTNGSTLEFTYSKGYDTTVVIPQLNVIQDYAYTRYQTAILTITDTSAGFAVGDTQDFDVNFTLMPNIAELQDDYASNRDYVSPQGDYLIKAPVPCFVSVSINVFTRKPSTYSSAQESFQIAVANAINAVKFETGRLASSIIVKAMHGLLTDDAVIDMPIDMTGQIVKATGDTIWLRDTDALVIPSLPDEGISNRTTAFFTTPENIVVNFVQLDVKAV